MTDSQQQSASPSSVAAGFCLIDGWLKNVKQVASPNYDQRPVGSIIDLLVVHCIALPPKQFGGKGIEQLFMNQLDPDEHPYYRGIADLKVSAHALIRRTGEIIQFVNFDQRAWHAGQSCYQGRNCCNDFSIGIELEGTDQDPYELIQYQTLVAMSAALIAHYPALTADRIAGHDTVAAGRKTDPGQGFDWPFFQTELATVIDQGGS